MCAMNGLDLPATCRLVADFSRTTCDHLDEHLLALISRHTQQWDKDYQQNQSFAGRTNDDLISKTKESLGKALDIFFGHGASRIYLPRADLLNHFRPGRATC
jgi:hypothetical protein